MSVTFREARRESIPLLLGVAGGTGSGKTFSALRLARGIAGGQPFAIIDTENGRAKHYADIFPEMRHAAITAPFRPAKYADAIQSADAEGFPVILVDSTSHEWAGDGGCLDWHDELMGGDQRKNLSAWIEPKREHKRMVTQLLQVRAHVILCFRAEPKVEAIQVEENGRRVTRIVAKPSLTGLDGWIPISEKMLPYELTAGFLLMGDAPGVPKPIKLPEQLRPFVPLDRPLSEETGRLLGEWAAGTAAAPVAPSPGNGLPVAPADVDGVADLLALADRISAEKRREVEAAIVKEREAHGGTVRADWLARATRKLETQLPADADEDQSSFAAMVPTAAREYQA